MEYEFVKDPWSTQNTIERPYLRRERLEKEDEAAFPLNAPMPRYLSFVSPNPNKWEHPRSYRIQVISFAGKHLPTSSSMERSISWGRWVPGLWSLSCFCSWWREAVTPGQACSRLQGRVKQQTLIAFGSEISLECCSIKSAYGSS